MTALYPTVSASSAPSRGKTRLASALLAVLLLAFAPTAQNAAHAAYPADEPTASETSGQTSDDSASADSNEKKQETQWFRLQYENNAPVELQTSIVRFAGEFTNSEGQTNPVSVDLIGAIHLADAAYYEQLNKAFAEYDVVVFELVAPKGTDIKALVEEERAAKEKAKEKNEKERIDPLDFVSFSQVAMSRMLDMVYQMDGVDYAADNLRRGDIDAEDFVGKLISNGDVENFVVDTFFDSFYNKALGQTEGWTVALLFAKDRKLTLKRLFAIELYKSAEQDVKSGSGEGDEEERENVIIHLRNEKAIAAARKELENGKTKLAIFYGAAHLPDLARRLETEFGLKRDQEPRWLTAWEMRAKQ